MRARWVAVAAVLALACGPAMQRARLSGAEPASPRELAAEQRLHKPACDPRWGAVLPGLGQLCLGKRREGALLLSLTAAETATAVTAAATVEVAPGESRLEHPAVLLPLVGLQDLWVYSIADTGIEQHLARRLRFAPQDTLGELAWAPFNLRVLGRPSVWLGIVGLLAAGIGVSALVDEDFGDGFGDDANLFGHHLSPELGYPAAGATFAGLFTHVAIAEESLFRGLLQSSWARDRGETQGWVLASLVFGAAHAPNALALEGDERRDYLLIGVPFITTLGSYLGLAYRWNDYSLAAPVAIHFWYDFLLSATFFAMDPENSPLSARISVPF